ncbi:MAG: potassium channel protein [Bacteroidales bacterium]
MQSKSLKHAYFTGGLLASVVLIGTMGYSSLGFTLSEAFYQTIITIATVGFEEVHPLDNRGMWFTSFLVIFSIGIFAYAVTTFTRYVVEGVFRNSYKDNKVKNKIEKLHGHVVICGYGRNGKQAAIELLEHQEEIVIVESKPDIVQHLRQTPGMLYIEGDATDENVLILANLPEAKALITTLPEDADNLFVVLTARELNEKLTIISRASAENSDVKLKRAGATNVIMPDRVGGRRMAKLVARPDVVEFIDIMMRQGLESVILEEISCASLKQCFDGKTIAELDIMNTSGANIIGLKRADNTYQINPSPESLLHRTDKLFALGSRDQIRQLIRTVSDNG